MQNVTNSIAVTGSEIMNAVFDAARANEDRRPVAVGQFSVEFFEMVGGHLALVKRNGKVLGSAMVDEFDC